MAGYLVAEVKDKKEWEDFVLSQNPKSFLQSWNWGETNMALGDKTYKLGYYNGNKLVGVCLAIKRTARRRATSGNFWWTLD